MTVFVIRHKTTKLIMPLAKRNRGYSHWNPAVEKPQLKIFTTIPRILISEKQAKRCISGWMTLPNARQSSYQNHDGEWDDILDFKDDGRKKEDLEIIEYELHPIVKMK